MSFAVLQFCLPEPMGSTPNHDGCKGCFCGGNPTWNSPSDHRKVAGSPSKGRQRTDIRVLCESWRLINESYFISLSWTYQMHPNAFRWHHLWLCPRSKSEILCSKQAHITHRGFGRSICSINVVSSSYFYNFYMYFSLCLAFFASCFGQLWGQPVIAQFSLAMRVSFLIAPRPSSCVPV